MVVVSGTIVKITQKEALVHDVRFNEEVVIGKLAEGF